MKKLSEGLVFFFAYETFAKMSLFAVWHWLSVTLRNINDKFVAVAAFVVVDASFDIASHTRIEFFDHFSLLAHSLILSRKNIQKF